MSLLHFPDPKQPYEEYYLSINFKKDLGTEEIASATVTVVDSDGLDVTEDMIDDEAQAFDGPILYFWIMGGETGNVYKITARIVGTEGSKYEADATLRIKET
jgi:hypothetical protein